MPLVQVPAARWERWCENFEASHGATSYSVEDGAFRGLAEDGSDVVARLPLGASYAGPARAADLAAAVVVPPDWGVLLVRKGGFAVARLAGEELVDSKVGQRHVQGRTKAGGQSQQRFARRRGNQARQAVEAAADHAARILEGLRGPVVTGGDHASLDGVLGDRRLSGLTVVGPWLAVPDPRRGILEQAARDAAALQVTVTNA